MPSTRGVFKRLIGSAVVFIIASSILTFLLLDVFFKPELENYVSSILGRRLTIESLNFQLLPTPKIVSGPVKVEGPSRWESLEAGSVEVFPDLSDLMRGHFRLRNMRLKAVRAGTKMVSELLGPLSSGIRNRDPAGFFPIKTISASEVTFQTPSGTDLGPYVIRIGFREDNRLKRLSIDRQDRSMKLVASADKQGISWRLDAKKWSLPIGPGFHFDRLALHGRLLHGRCEINELSARAHGGDIEGEATLFWDRTWRLTGQIRTQGVDLDAALSFLGRRVASGRLDSHLELVSESPQPAGLLKNSAIKGRIRLENGSIYRVGKGPLRFGLLEAEGRLRGKHLQISGIKAKAYKGNLEGRGAVFWEKDWKVSGRLKAEAMDIGALLSDWDIVGAGGRIQGDLRVDLRAGSPGGLLNRPVLAGRVKWTDGQIRAAPITRTPLRFRSLEIQGRLLGNRLAVRSLRSEAYGGRIEYTGTLSWGRSWRLFGTLRTQSVDMDSLLSPFGVALVSGRAQSDLRLDTRAPRADLLFREPTVQGKLRLVEGSFHNKNRQVVFPFRSLDISGRLGGRALRAHSIRARAYGGGLSGRITVSWGESVAVRGTLKAESIDSASLLSDLDAARISGRLDAQMHFAMKAFDLAGLTSNPSLEGRFRLSDGVIYRTDLRRATKRHGGGVKGGRTPFEELTGHLKWKDHRMALTGLRITSSTLEAKGDVYMDAKNRLSGNMDVGLRNASLIAGVPVVIGGTADKPRIHPTTEFLAGGAVGTVLFPGIGTLIGFKAGHALGKVIDHLKKIGEPSETESIKDPVARELERLEKTAHGL